MCGICSAQIDQQQSWFAEIEAAAAVAKRTALQEVEGGHG